jgi:hypothetical protein
VFPSPNETSLPCSTIFFCARLSSRA